MMRFTASQAFPCRSGIGPPHTTEIGTECAYVPPGPRMICASCLPLVVQEGPPPEPGTDLCDCSGQRHWTAGPDATWVHDKCGRPGFVRAKDKGDVMTPLGVEAAAAADAGTSVAPPADCPDRFPDEGERLAAAMAATGQADPLADRMGAAFDAIAGVESAIAGVPVAPPPAYSAEQLAQLSAGTVGAPVQTADVTTQTPGGAAIPPPMPATPPAQDGPPAPDGEKRGRGRPRKPPVAPGLVVEKLPGADKWCVVHEASGTPLIVGIASKAKAQEPLTRLGQARGIAWTAEQIDPAHKAFIQNEQIRVINAAAYDEGIYRDFTGDGSTDPDSGTGQPIGGASAGISAPEARGGPGSEGSREDQGSDQGGIATPVPGGQVGDSHESEHAHAAEDGSARGNADPQQGAAGSAPGILGTVGGTDGPVVPDSILNGGSPSGHTVTFDGVNLADYAVPVDPAGIPGLNTNRADADAAGYGADPRIETRDGHRVVWPAGGVGYAPGGTVDQPAPALVGPPERGGQVPGPSPAGAIPTAGPPGPVLRPVTDPPGTVQPVMPGTVVDSTKPSLAAFFAGTKSVQLAGNTPWAAQYAAELREILIDYAVNTERNLQVHLGPSEIGTPCDRQVVGKLVGVPNTNHVTDPWPSFMGTAGHSAMELVFDKANQRAGWQRWFTERKVEPHRDHRGTSDLYDGQHFCVDDHKFLGESSMNKLRSPEGPPIKYQFQLKLYARGYRNLGYRVDRIAIIGWPRTGASVDGMYVWEHVLTDEDDEQIEQLFARMAWRQDIAERIRRGEMYLSQVPAVPDDDDCYFCPFYRPQSAKDGGPGCPGHAGQ